MEALPKLVPLVVALGAAAIVAIGLLAAVLLLVFRRKKPEPATEQPDLAINVANLSEDPPATEGPTLECYSIPVRLAALVMAPVGRGGTIPGTDQLLNLVDQLVPGLVDLVSEHQPVVRFWPPQLSSQGFVQSFFNKVGLPGDRGKGTPWCSVAGKFASGGEQYLVGLVFRAASDNGMGQVAIEHEGQWNDVIRIRR